MDDSELLRYSRHIFLDAIGIEGQEKIIKSKILVVGVGGLGCAALAYLAASGIGLLTIVDDDVVEPSNLSRQILHRQDSVGKKKVDSARKSILEMNPACNIETICERLGGPSLDHTVSDHDIVLDCTDNFETRFALNNSCVRHRKTLVSGAATGFEGYAMKLAGSSNMSPCYACLFPSVDAVPKILCSTHGVFSPLVGIIGSLQANIALREAAQLAEQSEEEHEMHMFDAQQLSWLTVKIHKDTKCTVCSLNAASPINNQKTGNYGAIIQ